MEGHYSLQVRVRSARACGAQAASSGFTGCAGCGAVHNLHHDFYGSDISHSALCLKFDKVITLRKLLSAGTKDTFFCAFWSKQCLGLHTSYVPLRAMNRPAASQATKPHSSGPECGQRDEGRT